MRTRFIMVLTMLATLGGTDLFAQRWQNLHGPNNTTEYGRYGVQPVTIGGGYIAVGTTNQPIPGSTIPNRDVYVVRVSALGVPIWQNRYDISGRGSDDIGNCIVESLLNPGTIAGTNDFAITGYTTDTLDYCTFPPTVLTAPDTNVFFLRIASNGAVVTAATYGWNNLPEGGEYIRECQFGAAGFGTAPGNFIISGFCEDAASRDGYLVRVTSFGFLIWDAIYGGPLYDYFQGCLETQFGPAVDDGDIVAVGGADSWDPFGVRNGFVVRCDGNTGLIGAAPENAAVYTAPGGGVFTRFWTVEELSIGFTSTPPVFPGDLVMVGGTNVTNSAGFTSLEFYALRTAPNPCLPIIDRTYGDSSTEEEEYWTVKEIRGAPATTPLGMPGRAGNIVISGHTFSNFAVNDDATLHELATGTLLFAGLGYTAYGNGTDNQGAWSVHPVIVGTQGFILCGYWTPYTTPTIIDPSQLYLIKTNIFGDAGGLAGMPCLWWTMSALPTSPNYPPICLSLFPGWIMRECWVSPIRRPLPPWIRLCFNNPKEAMGEENTEMATAYVYPNPITQGTPLKVQYGSLQTAPATISISDMTGRVVFTTSVETAEGANEYDLRTEELVPGTYLVTVTADGVNTSQKFVVSEK